MLYNVLIVALMLVFCLLMQIFTVKVMTALFNSTRNEEEIKPVRLFEPKKKKASKKDEEEQRKFDTIMRNLEAYDGSGIGQEEVR